MSNKSYFVCNKCLERIDLVKCNCKNRKVVDIDRLIYPTIKLLNEKGYITDYCCSGHANCKLDNPYILFKYNYEFSNYKQNRFFGQRISDLQYSITVNDGYINLRTAIHFDGTMSFEQYQEFEKYKTIEEKRQAYINKVNKDLYEWAKRLPDLTIRD